MYYFLLLVHIFLQGSPPLLHRTSQRLFAQRHVLEICDQCQRRLHVPEQKQIASFLDYETAKIDALIEKQQQLIALLGEKRQAVISHAVTKGLNPDAPMRDSGVEWFRRSARALEVTRRLKTFVPIDV